VPVFAGEWGGGELDIEWAGRLLDYFDTLEMGWTAWSWHDAPLLVERYTPTLFGRIVRARLNA